MRVILENIRSVHNVASIFRSADGAGVEKIYLLGFSPDPFDRLGEKRIQFTKVSLGAEDFVEWERVEDNQELIQKLRKAGFEIIGVELTKKAIKYTDFRPKNLKKTVFVFGHEVKGVSGELLQLCDKVIKIPMHGKKESLNVSVATGIIFHHFRNA